MANPAQLDLRLTAGDDEVLEFELVDETGAAVDLTGRTYYLQVRRDPTATGTAECTFTCSVATPANGTITAYAPDTATINLTPGGTYYWSLLEYVDDRFGTLIRGRVTVLSQITKD